MAEVAGARSMAEIRDDILTDIVLESAKAGLEPNVGPGSDEYILATGVAGACMMLHARIDGTKSACTPITAVGEDLVRHKEALKVPDAPPSRAAGKIRLTITGTATIPDGQPGTLPNGWRGAVVGTWVSVVNGDEVDFRVDQAGSQGNARAGTVVTLLGAPTNVSQEASVSAFEPITGGFDEETEGRLRERVLNAEANTGGGSWVQLRQIALDTSPAAQQVFVFPTMGGPGQQKVVVLKRFDRDALSFSRAFPSSTLDVIRAAIHADVSTGVTTKVQASADSATDVTLTVALPESSLAGGSGEGWLDVAPWPLLTGAETRCPVVSVGPTGIVTLDADTAVSPIPGQTRVAWWSPRDMRFHVRTVITVGGATTAWALTPDTPWIDETGQGPVAGHYMCPAAANMDAYSETWVSLFESLGCGENTADSQLTFNGRGLRHPFISDTQKPSLTSTFLKELQGAHAEIEDVAFKYRSQTTPAVPGAIADPPNVLVPRHFAIYPA
ncbi:MAG TPA: baseplate J/gp47 family protein [Polyangiaceae bacterium]